MSLHALQPNHLPPTAAGTTSRRARRRRPTGRGVAIDLGTSTVRIASAGHVLLEEPTVIALSRRRRVVAVGTGARAMLGRSPADIAVFEPIVDGLIADVDLAEQLLRTLLTRVGVAHGWGHEVVLAVPLLTTDLQRRALLQCVQRCLPKADLVALEAPMAAAIGADLPVHEPFGTMVVDVGRGVTEAAVLSLGDMVTSHTAVVGGAAAEAVVADHLSVRHDLRLGRANAGRLVRLSSQPRCRSVVARGVDRSSGLPRAVRLPSGEVREVMAQVIDSMAEVARAAIDAAPDALAADIMQGSIVLTGGGSQLFGLPARIAELTGIDVTIRELPDRAVIDGARRCLGSPQRAARRR